MYFKRFLNLSKPLKHGSYFFFGPRATGKSSLIREQLKNAVVFDLLDDDVFEELMRRPKALSEKITPHKKLIVIDEVQKLPKLLDEVHRILQTTKIRFLLTGSSARKLKRSGANLLGGRAREILFFPLTSAELPRFDLIKHLNIGGLPMIVNSKQPELDLKAYVRTYLAEEIKAEAAVRNYERFVRFLETMALSNGQEINYANLASDSGVPARTIEGYLEVLKDTLVGFELLPFTHTKKRKAVTRSKFYFFDTGVANFLADRYPLKENHSEIGISFEQWMIHEIRAFLSYSEKIDTLTYWRSKQEEVDLIVGRKWALEFKMAKRVKEEHFSGLRALKEEGQISSYALVGRFSEKGKTSDGIWYFPFELFLKSLWAGKLL